MTVTMRSFDQTLRDMFPRPGERIKQYVVDLRARDEWEDKTCPRFQVDAHDDNTGTECRNRDDTQWRHLAHDCCSVCDELHEKHSRSAQVIAWHATQTDLPPIEADRTKLSDQVQEDRSRAEHPVLAMLPRRKS